jgi:hypothetical protein
MNFLKPGATNRRAVSSHGSLGEAGAEISSWFAEFRGNQQTAREGFGMATSYMK